MSQLRASRRKEDFPYFIYTPTETQMKNVVRGEDRYYSRRDPKLGMLIGALVMLAIFICGLLYLFGSQVGK